MLTTSSRLGEGVPLTLGWETRVVATRGVMMIERVWWIRGK
jgi:hypothetical protein